MPSLTRRRSNDDSTDSWHVYYGDVNVGWIGKRAGVPVDVDQWGWQCGFHPGLHPGQHRDGRAATFDAARAAFQAAWQALLPEIPDGAFDEKRYADASTAWKYKMWDCGCRMPTQTASGLTKCFCGVEITNASTTAHIRESHMVLA